VEKKVGTDKIDEAVLALLHLTRCDDKFGAAAWKSHSSPSLSAAAAAELLATADLT
jgi:hypothetical protein